MRVLVVEDHPRLAETVATVLRREGMAVDVAFDGREALARVALADYDVVVLDRDLPGVHGDEVCRAMVADGRPSRVLMLTAAGSLEDRVEGLASAPTTTYPSRFTSPSWSPGYARCHGARARRSPRRSSTATSSSTRARRVITRGASRSR